MTDLWGLAYGDDIVIPISVAAARLSSVCNNYIMYILHIHYLVHGFCTDAFYNCL